MKRSLRLLGSSLALLVLGACATATERSGFETEGEPDVGPTPSEGSSGGFDDDKNPPAPVDAPEVSEVFGHSGATLYRLDPKTKKVTVVGDFEGCGPVIDIALDGNSLFIAASYQALYTVDKTTAKCTQIAKGEYPNSLSFVPKGTVDPNEEALVGYDGGDYLRIDPKTGTTRKIGSLGGSLVSSGDIVSVKGGSTYLTVKGTGCTKSDCLVEVDPATGKMLKNWGSIDHSKVYGLSFWGGSLYGFDETGNLFEVSFNGNMITTQKIAIPNKPSDLSFWGAGSSTSAPLVAGPN